MTHKTGPRGYVLDKGFQRVQAALEFKPRDGKPPTASERLHMLHDAAECLMGAVQPWDKERDREFSLAFKLFCDLNRQIKALHRSQERILKYVLKPDEDELCPTCPKGKPKK